MRGRPAPPEPEVDPGELAERRHVRQRALVLAALGGLLLLVLLVEPVHVAVRHLYADLEVLIRREPALGAAAFTTAAALSAMLAFFSSSLLVPAAVAVWGAPLTALLLWVGWTAGGALAYGLSRRFGRPLVRALTSPALLARYEGRVGRHPTLGRVLLLQLALPSEIPGYLLGLARYPFGKFLLGLMLAELPFAAGAVLLGAGFLRRDALLMVGAGVAGLALSVLAFRALRRAR